MKFHWGTGLFTFYGLFVIAFLVVLYFASQSKTDLISETYYEDGVNYQQVIDKKHNSDKLSEKIKINNSPNGIEITFPESVNNIDAKIKLLRISDKNLDRNYTANTHTFTIPKNETVKGVYQLQIDWKGDNTEYYFEENIYAQ
jgi:hypothetical protein